MIRLRSFAASARRHAASRAPPGDGLPSVGGSSLLACPVCFGAEETSMIDGAKLGVLVMLGITFAVQGGFLAFFLYLRKRAKHIANMDLDTEWVGAPGSTQNIMTDWLGLPALASTHGGQIDAMIGWVHVFMLILFVGWGGGFFLYTLVRFRRSRNPVADYIGVMSPASKYFRDCRGHNRSVLLLDPRTALGREGR